MTKPPSTHEELNGYILVVDDDDITRLFIQEMLQQAGYQADFAVNGVEAISALESKYYDLVLMDCNMPIMDGFEATRLVREGDSAGTNPSIPIIALTGSVSEVDQLKCRDAGMNTCLSKPVESHTLVAAIEQCLGIDTKENPVSEQIEMQRRPGWNDGFLDTIISKFLAEVPQVIVELQRAAEQGDLVRLENIGHKLRGAADILETPGLSARSKALEDAGKAGELAHGDRLASELIKELHKLTTALKE